jgi:hypothetical protein
MSDILDRFIYHPPLTKDRQFQHHEARSTFLNVARDLDALLPEGREKELALTTLEEAMFWANAAIARQAD